MYKIAYQIAALALYFGQDKLAHQYLNMMTIAKRDKSLPEDQRDGLSRYLPRCQRIWEDREMHRSKLAKAKAAA